MNEDKDEDEDEDKNINLAEKIEKLIVDGQKEVVGRLVKLEEEVSGLRTGQDELKAGQDELKAGQKSIIEWVKKIDKKHDISTEAQYALLNDAKAELGGKIDRVERKLDAHLRQPAHA